MESIKVEVRTKLTKILQDAWDNTDSVSPEAYKFRDIHHDVLASVGFNSFIKTIHETIREQWTT